MNRQHSLQLVVVSLVLLSFAPFAHAGPPLLCHPFDIGDAKSLVIHPASTTHRQLDEEQQKKAGVPPDMVRLSIGLESEDDILWDIEQALEKA